MDSPREVLKIIGGEDLSPEDQKRMYNGLRAGKTVYEIMTVDELPQFLAMYPKYLLTFILVYQEIHIIWFEFAKIRSEKTSKKRMRGVE